jgi:hypothetical protein
VLFAALLAAALTYTGTSKDVYAVLQVAAEDERMLEGG